ncbi:MAG: transporter substrate-binding domain-containing protein [Spirochaetaceae bacterium]|nr:transporter substrate-binding domain-containing protein [Spirochaetaceae bacterium]
MSVSLSAQEGTLTIASEPDYPPFCIVDENGNAAGFSVDLFREAAAVMGYDVDIRVDAWNIIKEELAEGKIDALPLVGRSPQREDIYDFTFPYHTMHGAVFVRKGTDEIRSLSDLQSHSIITMKGDNAEEYVRDVLNLKSVYTTSTFPEAFSLLASGEHDAVIAQRLLGIQLVDSMGINKVVPLDIELDGFAQDFSFAVREGDKELLAKLNEGLSIVIANGVYDRLHKEWFSPILLMALSFRDKIGSLLWILVPLILFIAAAAIIFLRIELLRRTRRLLESEEKYRVITEDIDTIVWEFDVLNDSWTYVSPQSERILGYAAAEWTNLEFWRNRIHPEEREKTFSFCMVMSNQGQEHSFEYRFRKKDGEYIWLNDSVSVAMKDGKPAVMRGFMSDITERKVAELELRRRAEERELILREIYHRMKNNFANIENLISLQAMDSGDDNVIRVLNDTISRVKGMRILFEKLLQSKDLGSVSPKQYIVSLIEGLVQFFSGSQNLIELRIHIDEIEISQKSLFPLGIIINELITNVMKYAFDPAVGGLVEVSIFSENGRLSIVILDTGNQLPPDFSLQEHTGFGLQLVQILTHQMNCTFDIKSTAKGTLQEIICDKAL